MNAPPRPELATLIGEVVVQALADCGAGSLLLVDDASPEGQLCRQLLTDQLPPGMWAVPPAPPADLESVLLPLRRAGALHPAEVWPRLWGSSQAGVLAAHPVNRTALLLGGAPPPEHLLPLADLYASQVQELAGGWSAPAAVRALAEAAGGIRALDGALQRWLDQRDPQGLASLGPAADLVARAFRRGRPWRAVARLVPKLAPRTFGIDLHE